MKYGYFDNGKREYVIDRVDIPHIVDELFRGGGFVRGSKPHGRGIFVL